MAGASSGLDSRHEIVEYGLSAPRGAAPAATLAKFQAPETEQREVVAFVQSLKNQIVE